MVGNAAPPLPRLASFGDYVGGKQVGGGWFNKLQIVFIDPKTSAILSLFFAGKI